MLKPIPSSSAPRAAAPFRLASARPRAEEVRADAARPVEPSSGRDGVALPPAGHGEDGGEGDPWLRVRGRLREEIGEEKFSSWFARMELDMATSAAVQLSVPTRFLKAWIQDNYLPRIAELFAEESGAKRRVDLVVRSAVSRPVAVRPAAVKATEAEAVSAPRPVAAPAGVALGSSVGLGTEAAGSPLDPRLSFDSFVIGRSNALAHAAARQVAEAAHGAGPVFNPLYLHAAVGLGKTHLLQSVANAGEKRGRRTVYLTAERFMYGFVQALRTHSAIAFKDALRSIDTLVIDDLQFLKGSNLQQEFCHTLNALLDGGRQVVVAADCVPADLEQLDERVRSRLAGGLVVALGPLEEELRLEILKARYATLAEQHAGFAVPGEVLEFLARSVGQSGRDLDGALNKLLAANQLKGDPISLEMAETAVKDLIRPADTRRVRIDDILKVVAKHYNVTRADLLSQRRTANVVKPRQIAMYLAKVLTLRSLPEIGRRFGGRDHTTVLHAVRKIERLIATERPLAEEIEVLKRLCMEA